MAQSAGRAAIVPKGDWSASVAYTRLDAVVNNNILYIAKKDVPSGTPLTNTTYWFQSINGGSVPIATTTTAGKVKPDGTTITIDADGTIHGSEVINNVVTEDVGKALSAAMGKFLQTEIDGLKAHFTDVAWRIPTNSVEAIEDYIDENISSWASHSILITAVISTNGPDGFLIIYKSWYDTQCIAIFYSIYGNYMVMAKSNTWTSMDLSEATPISRGGTGKTSLASTNYTTLEYRGESLNSSGTTPTVNGAIAWTYS